MLSITHIQLAPLLPFKYFFYFRLPNKKVSVLQKFDAQNDYLIRVLYTSNKPVEFS